MESELFFKKIIFNFFLIIGKCAAASLDVLSGIFGDMFLEHLLPILKETLFHEKWTVCFL